MKDPIKSVVWTPKFFGNGIGKVTVGPFAHFSTPAGFLFRKIGASGMLMEREVIYNIWSKRHLSQISTPTAKHNSAVLHSTVTVVSSMMSIANSLQYT
jgi:hypothetical protein